MWCQISLSTLGNKLNGIDKISSTSSSTNKSTSSHTSYWCLDIIRWATNIFLSISKPSKGRKGNQSRIHGSIAHQMDKPSLIFQYRPFCRNSPLRIPCQVQGRLWPTLALRKFEEEKHLALKTLLTRNVGFAKIFQAWLKLRKDWNRKPLSAFALHSDFQFRQWNFYSLSENPHQNQAIIDSSYLHNETGNLKQLIA